ncbi:MAG: hypothetical protein OCC49_17695 [Fibrobacterales bacterium]
MYKLYMLIVFVLFLGCNGVIDSEVANESSAQRGSSDSEVLEKEVDNDIDDNCRAFDVDGITKDGYCFDKYRYDYEDDDVLGYAFTGTSCDKVYGCECEGKDCDKLFESKVACLKEYQGDCYDSFEREFCIHNDRDYNVDQVIKSNHRCAADLYCDEGGVVKELDDVEPCVTCTNPDGQEFAIGAKYTDNCVIYTCNDSGEWNSEELEQPVCGLDGVEYKNSCSLDSPALYKGACQSEIKFTDLHSVKIYHFDGSVLSSIEETNSNRSIIALKQSVSVQMPQCEYIQTLEYEFNHKERGVTVTLAEECEEDSDYNGEGGWSTFDQYGADVYERFVKAYEWESLFYYNTNCDNDLECVNKNSESFVFSFNTHSSYVTINAGYKLHQSMVLLGDPFLDLFNEYRKDHK